MASIKKAKKAILNNDILGLATALRKIQAEELHKIYLYAAEVGTFEALEVFRFIPYKPHENPGETTALHIAVKRSHFSICQYLLSQQSNPNIQDEDGNTPLFIAGKNKDKVLTRLLVQNGANPGIRNKTGQTVINMLEKEQGQDLISIIIEKQVLADRLDDLEANMEGQDQNFRKISGILENMNERFAHLEANVAGKTDIQNMLSQYVILDPAQKNVSQQPKRKSHIYETIEEAKNDPYLTAEEIAAFTTIKIRIQDILGCGIVLKNIADYMMAGGAMNDEQMECFHKTPLNADKVRYLVHNVVISGRHQFRLKVFIDALKEKNINHPALADEIEMKVFNPVTRL